MWGESKMRGDDPSCSTTYWIKILSDSSGAFNSPFTKGSTRDIHSLALKNSCTTSDSQ